MKSSKLLIFSMIAIIFMASVVMAKPEQDNKTQPSKSSLILDADTYLDINKLLCFIYNNGNFAYDNANVLGKTDGLYFPRGTNKTVVYSAGLWIGALVNGGVRVTVAEYGAEYVPGNMENGNPMPDNPSFKVYKINRGDNEYNNPDYANWPVDQGAPVDEFGNPKLYGDQMKMVSPKQNSLYCHCAKLSQK